MLAELGFRDGCIKTHVGQHIWNYLHGLITPEVNEKIWCFVVCCNRKEDILVS